MKKILKPLRVLSKIAIASIGVGLLIAIFYLVISQYRSQVALQQTALKQVSYVSERRATAFGYFLSEQQHFLKELAESREFKAYFENKALGMSMEYGLQASILIVTEHFDDVRKKKNLDNHPMFERIVFVDKAGRLLNDSRSPEQNWSKARDWLKYISPISIKPVFICDKEEEKLRLIISVPSFFKERYVGQVMGWISFSEMYKYFFESQNTSSRFPDVIVYGKEYLHIPSAIKPLLTSYSTSLPEDIQPGKFYPLPAHDNGSGDRPAYAILFPVKDTPFSLLTVIPPSEQFDFRSPRQLLYTTGGLALFIVVGMFILVRLNTNNALLKASLEETLLREEAVDAKNRELASEISERLLAEEEKAKLENQLLQSQKMEAVGKLAGGVAHDFNNMLGVIIGYSELAMMRLEPSQPVYDNLIEIRKAAERSADLTRQLLAFARKQTIAPKVINLNETITGMLKMLQRLLGENINLTLQSSANLWRVKADPSQIDQMLANLCVNSRDAIRDLGRIAIETTNCTVDVTDCITYTDVEPGEYVRLSVSDNGSGMDKEMMTHIFEPFFTTKGVGEGTGLGLATVYGIVKQNNGFINVQSEQGQGTTFTIYLPRHIDENCEALNDAEPGPDLRGTETILLVEDEPAILKMAAMMLEGQGYTVIMAGTADEAIRKFREQLFAIHMVMTDVVMPDMNGRDLVDELLKLKPQLKSLFMSGYSANVIAHHGVLDEGVHFIQKPFPLSELTSKVREVLDK
ncbi:MAG: ATP-binding protein [Desulfuromonadaceae bacterium]|nr:ATP-binding protein [Desulfuromonadaceae bacterium]